MTNQSSACPDQEHSYRVVPSVHFTPAMLALAPRYRRIEDAYAAMGEGLVLADDGRRVAAFHEHHLRFVEHAVAVGRLSV